MFQPFEPVDPPDSSKGDEALAQGFEQFSQGMASTAGTVGQLESRQNMLLATNAVQKQQQGAQLAMMQNPAEAPQIADAYNKTVQGIEDNTALNSNDRTLFNRMTDYGSQAINYKANTITVQQAKLQQNLAFMNEQQGVFQQYSQMLMKDPEAAGQFAQKATQTAAGLYQEGVITQTQYENTVNTFANYAQAHTGVLSAINQGQQLSAQQYHQYLHGTGQDTTNAPTDGNVGYIHESLNADTTYQDAYSGIVSGNGVNINYNAINSMQPAQRDKILQAIPGAVKANASYTSGVPYPVLAQRYQQLKAQNQSGLSLSDQAEERTLQNIFANGNYIDGTSAAKQLQQDYTQKSAAIQNSGVLSPDAKAGQMNKALNDYLTEYVNLGRSLKVPSSQINPVPPMITQSVQSAFSAGGNPDTALTAMNNIKPQLRPFLANGMKSPAQQMTMLVAGFNGNGQFSRRMILANQDNIDYSSVTPKTTDFEPKAISDKNLTAQVAVALQPTLSFLQTQPNASQQINSLVKAATNDIKFQCLSNNDLTCRKLSDYLSDTSSNIANAFSPLTGNGYNFNTKLIPLTEGDANALTPFMLHELGKHVPDGALDNETLTVTNTPDGEIAVMNSANEKVYSQPYTSTMQAAAYSYQKKQQAAKSDVPTRGWFDLKYPRSIGG